MPMLMGMPQVDVFHLDRQRGGRLDQLAAILDAENQQHGEQEAADCMHRDAHDGAELFGHQILNESDGDVAAVAVDAGRAQEGGPDEQIARHLVGPAREVKNVRQMICAVVMTTIRPSMMTMATLHTLSSASLTGERIFLSAMGDASVFPIF